MKQLIVTILTIHSFLGFCQNKNIHSVSNGFVILKNHSKFSIKGICSINGENITIPSLEQDESTEPFQITIQSQDFVRFKIETINGVYKIEPIDFHYQLGEKKHLSTGSNILIIDINEDLESNEKYLQVRIE